MLRVIISNNQVIISNNLVIIILWRKGRFTHSKEDAVVLLEKTPFSAETLPQVLSEETSLSVDLKNDIYSQYMCQLRPELNTVKSTVIYPATAKHLEKYAEQKTFLIYETPQDYTSITEPYVTKKTFSIQVGVPVWAST